MKRHNITCLWVKVNIIAICSGYYCSLSCFIINDCFREIDACSWKRSFFFAITHTDGTCWESHPSCWCHRCVCVGRVCELFVQTAVVSECNTRGGFYTLWCTRQQRPAPHTHRASLSAHSACLCCSVTLLLFCFHICTSSRSRFNICFYLSLHPPTRSIQFQCFGQFNVRYYHDCTL